MATLRALFLHWGPGGNAALERRWFGHHLPIDWWDQPTRFTRPESALAELLDAADRRLRQLSEAQGGPVRIVAHSFGGQVALALARRSPDRIAGMTLLSCSTDIPRAFVNLGRKLEEQKRAGGEIAFADDLRALTQAAATRQEPETFWPLMAKITSAPDFFPLYWGNRAALARYAELSRPLGPPIDTEAMQALMDCVLAAGAPAPLPSSHGIEVTCFLGRQDGLQDTAEEERAWRRLIPGAKIIKCEGAGHFCHLELEPEAWAPRI